MTNENFHEKTYFRNESESSSIKCLGKPTLGEFFFITIISFFLVVRNVRIIYR